MNKHKFVQYLRSPKELDRGALIELESIVEEYPYFQSARTLLAKAGKNLKSKKTKLYVSSAAVYATDRALLKRYINDELIFLNPLTVHESHEAELERDLTKAVKSNKIATSRNKKEAEVAKPKTKSLKISNRPKKAKEGYLTMDDLKSDTHSDLDDMIAELYKDMEELKVNREKLKNIEDQLEEDAAVDEALKKVASQTKESKATDKEESQKPEESEPENPSSELKTEEVNKETLDNNDEEKESSEETTSYHREKEPIKKASESRSARISPINKEVEISKSLTGGARKSDTDDKDEESEDTESDPHESKTKEVSKTSEKSSAEKTTPSAEKDHIPKKDQNQIIDDFIKNNPSITPVAKDNKDFNQSDLSWTSGDLHPDIASEYLAEIYLEQGHKDRALQILEALIVRFPEKSIYFADIIKKINEKE